MAPIPPVTFAPQRDRPGDAAREPVKQVQTQGAVTTPGPVTQVKSSQDGSTDRKREELGVAELAGRLRAANGQQPTPAPILVEGPLQSGKYYTNLSGLCLDPRDAGDSDHWLRDNCRASPGQAALWRGHDGITRYGRFGAVPGPQGGYQWHEVGTSSRGKVIHEEYPGANAEIDMQYAHAQIKTIAWKSLVNLGITAAFGLGGAGVRRLANTGPVKRVLSAAGQAVARRLPPIFAAQAGAGQARALRERIQEAVDKYKAGKYEEVERLLTDQEFAKSVGLRLDRHTAILRVHPKDLTKEQIDEITSTMRMRGMSYKGGKVELCTLPISVVDASNPVSTACIPELGKQLTPIMLEEWMHQLQYATSQPVSKLTLQYLKEHNLKWGENYHELDIIAAFYEWGFPVSDIGTASAYPERQAFAEWYAQRVASRR
jgi:hypothetical protein